MSKMDNLRAMREARYEAAQAQSRAAGSAPAGPTRRTAVAMTRPTAPTTPETVARGTEPDAEPAATEALCGHRNMGGRTCTREAGHAAKSHRYS